MKRIYFISPVGADSGYVAKRRILEEIANIHRVEFFFPLDHRGVFSLSAALDDIRSSELVIADLSLERPSCYFEVGLAQGIGAHVVLIAEDGTRLHQAADAEKVISYGDLTSYRRLVETVLAQR